MRKRPTIDNDENISTEVHLLNLNQDIYGEKLRVWYFISVIF